MNWLGINRCDDNNEYDVILSDNVVERVALPYSSQGIVVIDIAELEGVTVSESVDGSVVVLGVTSI